MNLTEIENASRIRHEKARKAARAKGRDFPSIPFECSWAFEEQFRRETRLGKTYDLKSRSFQ
jgi:hypothetical protein